MPPSPYEAPIRARIQDKLASASHDFDHLNRVLTYALGLAATYGGDTDVITAAALLHDLGRNIKHLHGQESAEASVTVAAEVLQAVNFPPLLMEAALSAIQEHDQPDVRPSTLEGRILKDADFLAGFGAIGVIRAAMWTGESGGTLADLRHRLDAKMAARFASLEFEQSRYHAQGEYLYSRAFLETLNAPPALLSLPRAPYIVVEGISGAGKDTQIRLLLERLQAGGLDPLFISEPTEWFYAQKDALSLSAEARLERLVLLMADRLITVRPQIESALAAGRPVVTSRSYLSTMVYQADSGWTSPAHIAYLHRAMPQPTHIFLIDVPPEEALRRIQARDGQRRGDFESVGQLNEKREAFLALRRFFPQMHLLDGTQTPQNIHMAMWEVIGKAGKTLL